MRTAAVAPLLLQLAAAFPSAQLQPRQAADLIDLVVGNITKTGADTASINNTLNGFSDDATDIGFNAIALLGGSTNVQNDLNLTAFSANQSSAFTSADSSRIVAAVEGILPATFDTLNNFVAHCQAFLNTKLSNAVFQQLQIQRELAREEGNAVAAKLDPAFSSTASLGISAILSVFDSAISVFTLTACPTGQTSAVPPTAPGGTTSTPVVTSTPIITSTPSPRPTTTIATSTPITTSTPVVTSTPVTSSKPVSTSTPVTSSKPVSTSTPVTSSKPISTSTPVVTSTPKPTSTPCPESSTPVVSPVPGTSTVTKTETSTVEKTTTVEKTAPAQTVTVTATVEKTAPAQTITVTATVEKTQPAQTVTVTASGAPAPYGYGGQKTVTVVSTVEKTAPCAASTSAPAPYGYGSGGQGGHEGGHYWGWPWGHGW